MWAGVRVRKLLGKAISGADPHPPPHTHTIFMGFTTKNTTTLWSWWEKGKIVIVKHDNTCESWTKEGWTPKNWCFRIVVLEKTLESSLDFKEIKPVNPKVNQPWIFIGRTDAKVETPILWPPDAKNRFIGKDPDAGKDWGQDEGATEDEMVGWHHQVNGQESEQTLGDSKEQGSSPWGYQKSDTSDSTTTTTKDAQTLLHKRALLSR